MQKEGDSTISSTSEKTSWKEASFLLIKGFLMGSADIVPGVSGGTMALIVGIYSRLIHAIKSFDIYFLKQLSTLKLQRAFHNVQWRFVGLLLCGIFCAVLFFTKVVPLQVYMFTDPELVFGLFFGLIVGSIFILIKAIDNFYWLHGLMVIVGATIGFWVVTLVPTQTPESSLFVFFSGAVAICAMILPGISGSYILLILRKYDFVLSQVGKLGTADSAAGLLTLLPFVLGAVCGLAIFSRILSWLLDRFEGPTLAVLIGFLIGSLYVIWPYQDRTYTEIITHKEVIEYSSPQAQALRTHLPDEQRPEFERLGEVIKLDTSTTNSLKNVELLSIKKKLINSDPYIPYVTVDEANTPNFWEGILGIALGLIMVVGLDYLRMKK